MASLLSYVLRRILFALPVFLAVSIITYLVTNAAGDPINIVKLGIKNATPVQLALLRAYFHEGDPVYVRYFYWLGSLLQGDLGKSLYTGTVASNIGQWIWTTLELQLPALFLSLGIGIPIGVYGARHQYTKADVSLNATAIFGFSMPTFWLGLILIIVFSANLHWLPSSGAISGYPPYWWGSQFMDGIAHVILPLSVLTFVSLAFITRLVRANMLEALRQDFVLGARASGLSERTVTYKHALKNAITPIVTVVGLSFGTVLGGAPALETTFGWPGLGYTFVQAVSKLDLPLVLGITMVITVMVLTANVITDLAYAILDPRVRLG